MTEQYEPGIAVLPVSTTGERSRPRLLDLFCGAGGAAVGYHRAGFEVVGVDLTPQPRFPLEFHQADAMTFPLDGFDVIHASPPCQAYSILARRNGNAEDHQRLIPAVREMLRSTGLPHVIENVEGAPLDRPIRLCGTAFAGLRVIRHRLFESNVALVGTPCPPHHPLTFTHDKRKGHYGKLDQDTSFVQVNGGGNCTVANASDAMGIDWMTKAELNEAIPPAYAEHIGRQIMAVLTQTPSTTVQETE